MFVELNAAEIFLNSVSRRGQLYNQVIVDKSEITFNRLFPHSNKQWHRVEVRVDVKSILLCCYYSYAIKCNAGKSI